MAKISKVSQFIRKRREELDLTQAQVASAIGVGSPEFISMLEQGIRSLDLNRIPKLADILQTDRKELCKLALYEQAPVLYSSLFGQVVEFTPQVSKSKSNKQITVAQETVDFFEKLYSLPSETRNHVISLVDQLFAGVTTMKRSVKS